MRDKQGGESGTRGLSASHRDRGGIRTHTEQGLSLPPLPLGYTVFDVFLGVLPDVVVGSLTGQPAPPVKVTATRLDKRSVIPVRVLSDTVIETNLVALLEFLNVSSASHFSLPFVPPVGFEPTLSWF